MTPPLPPAPPGERDGRFAPPTDHDEDPRPEVMRARVRERMRDGVSAGMLQATREAQAIRARRSVVPARRARRGRLWSSMFLLHQILGLASGLVVAIACFTGALLVFKTEIIAAMHPARSHVTVGATRIGVDSLVSAAAAAAPKGRVLVVTTYADPARPISVVISPGVQLWVDPYTARVVDVQRGGNRFFEVTEAIHRRLLAGEIGRRIVGIATLCFVVILLSGVVIWWPQTVRTLRARLTMKHPAGWKRRNYDLHVVLGIYATLVLLAVGATGLVWSFRTVGEAVAHLTPPGKETPPAPHSVPGPQRTTIDVQSALASASAALGPTTSLAVDLPTRPRDAIMVLGLPPHAPWRQALDVAYLDRYSGRVLRVDRFAKLPPGEYVRRITNPIHVGSLYGLPSEIAAFIACLIGTLAPFTGAVIWINRKWPRALRWPLRRSA